MVLSRRYGANVPSTHLGREAKSDKSPESEQNSGKLVGFIGRPGICARVANGSSPLQLDRVTCFQEGVCMIWDVEIVCDQPILADLADGLHGEGVVVASGASHKLNPTLFDSTARYDETMAIASHAVDEINGFLKLFLGTGAKVSVGRVSREEPGEPRVHYISVMDSVSLSSSVVGGTLGSGVDVSPAGAAVVLQLPDY